MIGTQTDESDESGRSRRSVGASALVLLGILGALLVLAGAAGATGALSDDSYGIDADHGLADNETIAEYESTGHATARDVQGLDATISYADDKSAVDRDGVRPVDSAHEYVRIEYREDISRTLRIWIPAEYSTPYERDNVEALESDHVATYSSARSGEYLQIEIDVDGETDVVLPVHKHSAFTYSIIQGYEERLAAITGSDKEWQYVDGDELAAEHSVELDVDDPESIVVQHDATPGETEESWVATPRDADGSTDGVYYYVDEERSTAYVVSQGEERAVRFMGEEAGIRERAEGHVNDARQIPDRIRDRLEDGLTDLF